MADSTIGKQRGRPFEKGRSGNPAGRPRGARNRATLAAEALLDGQAQALTQTAIDWALAGDPAALRLCMERIIPPRRDRPVQFDLPTIASAKDAATALAIILSAVGEGRLTPSEASAVGSLALGLVRAFEIADAGESRHALASAACSSEDARAAVRQKIEDFARRIRAQADSGARPEYPAIVPESE